MGVGAGGGEWVRGREGVFVCQGQRPRGVLEEGGYGSWWMADGCCPCCCCCSPPPPQDIHYTVDEKQRNVLLTEDGYEAVEDVLQVCVWGGGGTMYVYVTACTGWACE